MTWHCIEIKRGKRIKDQACRQGWNDCEYPEDLVARILYMELDVLSYVPMYTEATPQKGRRRAAVKEKHLALPGWLLIDLPTPELWPAVLQHKLVGEPLRAAGVDKAHAIPQEQIDALRRAEAENFGQGPKAKGKFKVGETVMAIIMGSELRGTVKAARRDEVDVDLPIGTMKISPADLEVVA